MNTKSNKPAVAKPTKAQLANQRKLDSAVESAIAAIGKADANKGSAMLAGIRSTALGGFATVEMLAAGWPTLGEGSRPGMASNLNLGGKVASIIGLKATLALIDRLESENPSCRWDAVLSGLRAVNAERKVVGEGNVATTAQVVAFVAKAAQAGADTTTAKSAKKVAVKKAKGTSKASPAPVGDVDPTRGLQPVIGVKSASLHLHAWCDAAGKIEDVRVNAIVAQVAKWQAKLAKLAG